ncbi:hypothetical protein ACFU3J_03910 [Streptomyces sp. NPDC057411]|uniref:hypothetical protein n=1 Tax=unclassified Streptomyces TaxID=2593676 RepID=UPI0036291FE3
MERNPDEIDQIVFRWDSENVSGTTGFGPVAWSGAREDAEGLFQGAGALLRASGDETRPALIRLQRRGGEAVLIRRLPWTDPGGGASTICHALVGSPEVLGAGTCLGLHAWTWSGADLPLARVRGALPTVWEEALLEAVGRGQAELDARLPGVVDELVGVMAELLRRPDDRFTLLDETGDTSLPVLWGLHSIFGSVYRRWTFATHDTAELPALRFVFVSRWTGAASRNTDRRRADPLERLGDAAESVAARLVEHHLRGLEEGDNREFAVDATLRQCHSTPRTPLLTAAQAAVAQLDRRFPARPVSRRPAEEDRTTAAPPGPSPTEPARRELPRTEPPRTDPPRTEPPRTDPPRTDPPPTEPTRTDPPRTDPPPTEPPRTEAPRVDPPRTEPSRSVPPSPTPVPPLPKDRPARPAADPTASPWAGPAKPGRRLRRRRGPAPKEGGLGARLDQAANVGEAQAAAREAADSDLLAVLRDRRLPYRLATVLVQEIARRIPAWNRALRHELRDLVLGEAYFVYRSHPADRVEPAERAADAAALHRWAVRPVLGTGRGGSGGRNAERAVADLAELLARFRTSPHPAARGTFLKLVRDERSGLPESVLRSLVLGGQKAAERDHPPDPPPPRRAAPTPAEPVATRPAEPAPPSPSPPPAPAPPRQERSKDGMVVVSVLGAVLVLLLIVIFASFLTR